MKILVLEDHEESRRVMAQLLEYCGHTVRSAESLSEADALLGQESFEVMLSDIGLLDGDAFDLVQRAKTEHGIRAAVALTGHPLEQDGTRARAAGFDHYLTKPVDFHVLRSLLSHIAVGV